MPLNTFILYGVAVRSLHAVIMVMNFIGLFNDFFELLFFGGKVIAQHTHTVYFI